MKKIIVFFIFFFLIAPSLPAQEPSIIPLKFSEPSSAKNGMVVTQEALATEAGLQVLKEGGNAIDAAVTVGFTLAATLPRAGNLGGGGFMLIYLAGENKVVAIDYREKAPRLATRDMFLNENGDADPNKSRYSALAVGVPGTVAGLSLVLQKYGTISLEDALIPGWKFAKYGFPAYDDLVRSLRGLKKRRFSVLTTMKDFFKENGDVVGVGELFVQKDLAWSFKQLMENGPDAFYKGEIAKKIDSFMQTNGGLISKEDLSNYQPVIREPIHGSYRGYDIYSMPPPSSGGVHIVQILNILEGFDLTGMGHNSSRTIHAMAEAMKFAYADRSKHLGDSDFIKVPIQMLTSEKYAKETREKINLENVIESSLISPGVFYHHNESTETTHFSVIDRFGNIVSNTYTLNFNYGAGLVVPGTGILLNNEMDDFSAKPGVPNAYGLIGGEANAVAPNKRMLSSMSPTIILKDGNPFLVTGSPGGSRIITIVLQIILNVIDHKMNIQEATNAARIHHQWLPDELSVEDTLSQETIDQLMQKGFKVVQKNAIGATQSIMEINNTLYGATDPRRPSGKAAGY